MKIPETSANVGAYYGNEENGQWQPNGVIIDNGVGGGVVGSGDAGMHRAPVYPVHIPRGHVPAGYVMAGAYYGAPPPYGPVPPPQPDDFSDYMWMENEEEFDKQVLQQLEEEALMEQCIEAMLEDEQRERRANRENRHDYPTTSNGPPSVSLQEAVSRSTLNPLAAEFVPTARSTATTVPDEKRDPSPPQQTEAPSPNIDKSRTEDVTHGERERDSKPVTEETKPEGDEKSRVEICEEAKTEETVTPPKDPPEVSAADIHPTKQKKDKEVRKPADLKRPAKLESKKKPVVVKSETKVQPKKKDVKPVKSDPRIEDKIEDVITEVPKPQPLSTEETQTAPGPKPINYAAAAKASKPKLKPTTPPIEKPQTTVKTEKPKTEKVEKKITPKDKIVPKEKVNVQRKNSAKQDENSRTNRIITCTSQSLFTHPVPIKPSNTSFIKTP